ncbi:hypothetical protein O6H91_09G058800 [Diphasiastrum complanatum]|uniref:Uncharacterized protein n=1 Tax=Diphasiastrum complanatum TaxID=34168 RepID=A0ACC2CPG2_DIPCM|nr:hypothetical protein O6H91_09G058800 [Diphasiastrum complanatum]
MGSAARRDGRTAIQLRPLACTRGLLNRAHGSARWSQENTCVLAAVYGPKSISGRRENPERATIEVIWKPKSGMTGNKEKEAELVLRRSLDYIIIATLHPNTGMSIIVQVISDDGALLACAINATTAALVDTGIPLSGLIAAVSCGINKEGDLLLDLTKSEEQEAQAHVCLVFPNRPLSMKVETSIKSDDEPVEHGLVTSVTCGAMSVDDYLSCLDLGRAASLKISEFSRTSLEQSQRAVELVTPT